MGANAQTSVPAFTAGQVLTAAQMTQVNTGIPVFASSTERDAAFGGTGEKTLAEGQMAYLEDTNETQVYDGSEWAAVGGGGKILQVVQGQSTVSFATSSSSMVDVTDVTLTITPTAATSKVLVVVTGVAGNTTSAAGSTVFNIVRDSTAIGIGTGGTYNHSGIVYNNNTSAGTGFALSHLDSPATTSATTYKLQTATINAGVVVGRTAANDQVRVPTTITAMEISA